MSQRRVLLVEDDAQMADLLSLLVRTADPATEVDHCADVGSAEALFSPQRHRLVLCDWNLPGKPGIALLPVLRRQPPRVPVLMVTGRSDRASVIAARGQGVDGFIVKPFDIEKVLARLRDILGSPDTAVVPDASESPLDYLGQLDDAALERVIPHSLGAQLQRGASDEAPDLLALERAWQGQPALVARLLAMANSSLYNPQGRLCATLHEALARLGWRTALNVATALSLRGGAVLADARLRERAEHETALAEEVAERAAELARRYGLDPAPCVTAALLHRLGELCVLYHLQAWQDVHGGIDDGACVEQALQRHGRPFADRLKALWRYPMPLRELIGAIYHLPPGTSRREKYVLRLAGGLVHGGLDEAEAEKLRRLAEG
jgi:HD-like signal output (HDOD) protein/ActR/RegA family two-component response regulator